MQKTIFFCFFFLVAKFSFAQVNLAPNPSFEDTIGCPSAPGDIIKASGWSSFCGSPDYYNTCNTNLFDMGVPSNWAGFQTPASGNAYSGFITYSNSSANAREFPACNLTIPLSIGTKYFISFKISLALTNNIQANCASDKIGAMFTMGPYICNSLILNNSAVYSTYIITDTLNWTRIFGSFVADSSYNYLVIGNFFDDSNTDTIKFFNDFSDNVYYYLDDVCVSTDSIYANSYSYTGVEENNTLSNISCYPNPVTNNLTINNELRQNMDVEIYNLFGELLFSSYSVSEEFFQIDLNNFSSGILLLKINSDQQINIYKLLKQ